MNLLDNVTKLVERDNAFSHYGHLVWALVYHLNSNRMHRAGINGAGVVLDKSKLMFIIKYRPIFLNKAMHKILGWLVELRKVDPSHRKPKRTLGQYHPRQE